MKNHNFVTMLYCDRIVIFSCYDNYELKIHMRSEDGIMESYIVETRNLKKYYQQGANTVKALDGVDFRVSATRSQAVKSLRTVLVY